MHLFIDNLSNVDFSYLCPRRGLVGETWLAHIELHGELDHQGMVCDFGVVKKALREWLDREIDHCLLVPAKSAKTGDDGERVQAAMASAAGRVRCTGPREAFTLIDCERIDTESVAAWSLAQLRGQFGVSIEQINIRFSTEAIAGPYYHYSHGLKKHRGNCQRIAHGHRSKLEIWRNGELDRALMTRWAAMWADIYIGTREDVASEDDSELHFAYRAEQGMFQLSLPRSRCYLIDADSTVERIAQHIAAQLKIESPTDRFTVKAYEGINKGAVVGI